MIINAPAGPQSGGWGSAGWGPRGAGLVFEAG
jgi:hypothetical protein